MCLDCGNRLECANFVSNHAIHASFYQFYHTLQARLLLPRCQTIEARETCPTAAVVLLHVSVRNTQWRAQNHQVRCPPAMTNFWFCARLSDLPWRHRQEPHNRPMMRVLLSCFLDSYTVANDAVGVLRKLGDELPPSVRALLQNSVDARWNGPTTNDQPSRWFEEHFT
jgi:hypothetical protein